MMKTFVICPGTERAGTSWLHKYLSYGKDINFGDLKEYHYFDSIHIKDFLHYKKNNLKHDILYKFYENNDNYYQYFLDILQNYKLTGDFSPGYSELNEEILLNIKKNFNNNNIDVKVIYLIRHPVDRHISATNLRIKYDHMNLNNDEYNKLLVSNLNDKVFNIHSKYEETDLKLFNIFKENYLIKKYEKLFNQKSTKQICNFLNINHHEADFNIKINEKPIYNLEIFESTFNELYKYYTKEINFFNSID